MSVRHSWSAGVDPRPDFPTSVHGRRILEDRGGSRARLLVPRPGEGVIELQGTMNAYRMAEGTENLEFTGAEVDCELLLDGDGEWAWLRLTHFHRTERHGLSWLRQRLVTARVRISAGWREGRPAWICHCEADRLVAALVVEEPLGPGNGAGSEAVLSALLADFLDGPPEAPEDEPSEPEPA